MFETLSTIALTAGASTVVAFLSHALGRTALGRLTVAGVLAAWFALVLMIGATAALDPGRGAGVPGLGLTVALPVAAFIVAFLTIPSIRDAMLATPLPALVAVNAIRILGVIFLVLQAAGTTGALRSERRLGRHFRRRHGAAGRLGDAAVRRARPAARAHVEHDRDRGPRERGRTGALSAPGPLQVFAGPPSSALMTTLPWLIIPGFLVPSLMFLHVVIFYRLTRTEAAAPSHPWLNGGAARGGVSV